MYPRGEGGGLGPAWFEGGEGVPTNPSNPLVLRRGQRMQIVHHLPVKNRRPMISLHVVSGPWTSIVAALDKGRSNIAVCRRYNWEVVKLAFKVLLIVWGMTQLGSQILLMVWVLLQMGFCL